MITTINQETLEKHLTFARDVKGSKIFQAYSKPLEEADWMLKRTLMGSTLYTLLQTAFSSQSMPANTAIDGSQYLVGCTLADIKAQVEGYLCNMAGFIAAGKNDVVQTTFGFGTVSGNNEAIASTARVDAMRRDCQHAAQRCADMLVKMLGGNSYTADTANASPVWCRLTQYLVWTQDELEDILPLNTEPEANSMAKWAASIASASRMLERVISPTQLHVLITEMRSGTAVTDLHVQAIDLGREYMAAYLANNHADMQRTMEDLYVLMEDNATSFSAYMQSATYKGRHYKGFENKPENPAYFMM